MSGVEMAVPSMEQEAPCVYLDLEPENLTQLAGLKVGDEVRVVLRGVVKALSQREDWDDRSKVEGDVQVRYRDVSISKTSDSGIAALAEDED